MPTFTFQLDLPQGSSLCRRDDSENTGIDCVNHFDVLIPMVPSEATQPSQSGTQTEAEAASFIENTQAPPKKKARVSNSTNSSSDTTNSNNSNSKGANEASRLTALARKASDLLNKDDFIEHRDYFLNDFMKNTVSYPNDRVGRDIFYAKGTSVVIGSDTRTTMMYVKFDRQSVLLYQKQYSNKRSADITYVKGYRMFPIACMKQLHVFHDTAERACYLSFLIDLESGAARFINERKTNKFSQPDVLREGFKHVSLHLLKYSEEAFSSKLEDFLGCVRAQNVPIVREISPELHSNLVFKAENSKLARY